jgi:spore maturation protein CgeB
MSRRPVVLVAPFDDALHAHNAQRARALERLGCDVTTVNVVERRGPLGLFRVKDLRTRLEQALDETNPELVLVTGVPELDPLTVATLRGRTRRARWVNWLPNDRRTMDRALRLAGAYDRVFAIGTDVARRLEVALRREVPVLPLGCDPSVYRPVRERQQQYRANVVFAGTATPYREALLAQLVEFGLAIWGPGWRETSLRDYCRGERLHTHEFVRAYAGATVGVNIHHVAEEHVGPEASCNQRTFEIAAIGTLQVVDRREDLARWFEPMDEVLVYEDGDHLRRTVADLLQDLVVAERIAAAGRRRVLAEHTYMHRMRWLLDHA